ncbi:MAG: TIGR04053 family radical SAM/SPASM domain-containing protein [Armatimonadetes bacterium]|nr:TIGR04053 family radical SAM/SPASM domain-containing protein [Armatimonadota bacterium]
MAWDMDAKPRLVFWETTRACDLACRHCRASAIATALPGELNHEEGIALVDSVAEFGRPYPILILTGGDVLKRRRLWELITHARSRGIPVAVSPSVTPLLDEQVIRRFAEVPVAAMSLSLDGAGPRSHDELRQVPGTWNRTMELLDVAVAAGIKVQINTTVMGWNLRELPELFELIRSRGAHIWEVFFLIHQGRGTEMGAPTPQECESVCRFLVEAAGYGLVVRTVEAPFFRRVVSQKADGSLPEEDALTRELVADLRRRLGAPTELPRHHSSHTRDGRGIVFVDYKGDVSPSGFLPVVTGNVRTSTLAQIYQEHPLFRELRRAASFGGRCGVCTYRELCGGSRARAFSFTGDSLAEDPACAYQPVTAATI